MHKFSKQLKGAKIIVLLACLPTACVTTHQGEEIESGHAHYSMSCAPRSDIQTATILVLSCVVENKGRTWSDFKIKSIRFSDKSTRILSASDIKSFEEAYAEKAAKDDYNASVILSSLIVGGIAAMVAGGHTEGNVGAVVAAGAMGAGAARDFAKQHAQAQNSRLNYSSDHLFGPGFRLPPELFVRKFLVIEDAPDVAREDMTVCFTEPVQECLKLPIEERTERSRRAFYR